MSMSASLSFLQSACAYSQQQRLYLRPKLECLGSSSSYEPLIVEAKARTRREDRAARHSRLRKKVEGTPERPRLCVFRSNKHLYVQVIDDTKMHTLASASTMQKPISEEFNYSSGPTIDVAKKVGEVIAKSCLDKGITKVAFDRGGYLYHGRIEAVADAAREHDGVAVAVVDVLHITHAAIATVGSNAGVSNDSSPNMMQKFWDSAMALSPDEEEDAESDSSFKSAFESIETTRSLPYPSSILPNTFAFKIQDKKGRMHRFNCDTRSLTDLVTAILQRVGDEIDRNNLPHILYEDEDHDNVVLASDSDLAAVVDHARLAGWKVLKLHLDHSGTQGHRRGSQSGGVEYAQSDVWASAYSALAAGAALIAGLSMLAY